MFDKLDFLNLRDIPEQGVLVLVPRTKDPKKTYCISFSALFSPSLFQNSSKVASSLSCSLTRAYQAVPSFGPFLRWNVLTRW